MYQISVKISESDAYNAGERESIEEFGNSQNGLKALTDMKKSIHNKIFQNEHLIQFLGNGLQRHIDDDFEAQSENEKLLSSESTLASSNTSTMQPQTPQEPTTPIQLSGSSPKSSNQVDTNDVSNHILLPELTGNSRSGSGQGDQIVQDKEEIQRVVVKTEMDDNKAFGLVTRPEKIPAMRSSVIDAKTVRRPEIAFVPKKGGSVSQEPKTKPQLNMSSEEGQGGSNSRRLLPMPPMAEMQSKCETYKPSTVFSTEDFDRKLEQDPLFKSVYSRNIAAFGPSTRSVDQAVYARNILAVANYVLGHRNKYDFTRAHVFFFVNSTQKTRELAQKVLRTFSGDKDNEKQVILANMEFIDQKIPSWITKDYLAYWNRELIFYDDPAEDIDVKSLFEFDHLQIFKRKDVTNKEEIKLKLIFFLYIALTEKKLQKETKERADKLKEEEKRGSNQGAQAGLFTQPSVWCDDDTNESAWNNTRVCCRRGMCSAQPGVVQSTQSNNYLAYCTALRTHPCLNTFFTQAADPTRNGLPVFAVAPMHQMQYVVADTQRRQIYIWHP